jgi:hypothetical protein
VQTVRLQTTANDGPNGPSVYARRLYLAIRCRGHRLLITINSGSPQSFWSHHRCLAHINQPGPLNLVDMSQPTPRVRNACEACHKRKQRCILPDAGGSCNSCRQNARHCFFVPRVKPGRQRRGTMERFDFAGSSESSGTSALSDTTSPFSGLGASYDSFAHGNPQPRSRSTVTDHENNQQDMDGLWDSGFVVHLMLISSC